MRPRTKNKTAFFTCTNHHKPYLSLSLTENVGHGSFYPLSECVKGYNLNISLTFLSYMGRFRPFKFSQWHILDKKPNDYLAIQFSKVQTRQYPQTHHAYITPVAALLLA